MWFWARKRDGGRVTCAEPMFASPARGVTVAVRLGYFPRLVPPFSRSSIFGSNSSEEQKETWKGLEVVAVESSLGLPKLGPDPGARERVGFRLGRAARDRVAIEVFELRRQFPDDARFAHRSVGGKLQPFADECFPVTHGRLP